MLLACVSAVVREQQQQQQQQQQGDDPDNDDEEEEEEEEEFLDRQSAAEALQTWAVVARDMLTEEGVDIPATTDAAQPPPPRADDDTELILVNRATKCRVVQPLIPAAPAATLTSGYTKCIQN